MCFGKPASDAAFDGMSFGSPFIVRAAVAAAVVVVDIGKHISAVREEGVQEQPQSCSNMKRQ